MQEENKNLGFIKLYRSIIEWEWFTDSITLQVWIYILCNANHKRKKYKGYTVERGSFHVNYGTIAKDLEITFEQARNSIKKLKNSKCITITRTSKGLVISVQNYDDYQEKAQSLPNHFPITSHSHNNQITNTSHVNKNDKNVKNVKNERKESASQSLEEKLKELEEWENG